MDTTAPAQPAMIDLTATYTWTEPGGHQTTVTPKVRDRARPDGRVVSVSGIAPLLASALDAIADESDRVHALLTLQGAVIALRENPATFPGRTTALDGRVSTSYAGCPQLPLAEVLALGERLHAQLICPAARR